MRLIIALTLIGLSGCAGVSDAAFCGEKYTRSIQGLRAGLEQHPETPDAGGEPGADVVLGHEAGCRKGWLK